MLIKYFLRGIDIQKYSNVFEEECVVSPVGCLSLSRFDEISEAVSEAGTSLTEKAEQERKRLHVYAPMSRVLSCVLLTGMVKLFLEVEMKREREREYAVSVSQNGENEFLENESIFRQSLSCGWLQKHRTKSKVWT